MPTDRFNAAIHAFDVRHSQDPGSEVADGETIPKELLYARRMTDRLTAFAPEASEWVKLAVRAQHLGRWEIPRDNYPMDRKGYLQWRNDEKAHHAGIAETILKEAGYDDVSVSRVKDLILKRNLYSDPDTQLVEDVACLVFLEYYAAEFAAQHPDEKVVDILRKTLRKMSERARRAAIQVIPSEKLRSLVEQAGGH